MSWPRVQARRLFRVVNGGTPTPEDSNWAGGIPWATPVDLAAVDGRCISKTQRTLTEAGLLTGSRAVGPGSLIVSTRAPIGYVAQTTVAMALNQGCRGLEPVADLDVRFFRYQFLMMRVRLNAAGQGSTFVELSSEAIASTLVSVPLPEKQRAIADFLDVETARIDALVASRLRTWALLEERARTVTSATLTGHANLANPYPSGVRLSQEFPIVSLGRVATIQTGLTVEEARRVGSDAVERPYLRVANVQDGYLAIDNLTRITVPPALAARCELRAGDVLMTEGGDLDKLGRGTVWPGTVPGCLHQNHVFAVRPRPGLLDPMYLALMTTTHHARAYFESTGTRTTNLASTNASKIARFPVPLPPISIQRARVAHVQAQRERIRAAAKVLGGQLALLHERRQALITAAVTGDIEVTRGAA